jgi:imidazoleglycerol-phosphate dehydratase
MSQIGTVVAKGDRSATVYRSTKETQITVTLVLDGTGQTKIDTGVGFFDHLLNSLAHHALFDIDVDAAGDLVIDEHHTVEDVALVLGAAFAEALGERTGIVRFGDATVPMDESIATAAIDVGGRPYAVVDLPFKGKRAGKMPLELIEHVFESRFARPHQSVQRHDEREPIPEFRRRHRVEAPGAQLAFDLVLERPTVRAGRFAKGPTDMRNAEHQEWLAIRRDEASAAFAIANRPGLHGGWSISSVQRGQRRQQQGGEVEVGHAVFHSGFDFSGYSGRICFIIVSAAWPSSSPCQPIHLARH